ncbi:hypothetical protein M5K25_000995 [Dendrobium thyrsiflorum]|uniref:Uncharacterized protein n=1 Tax=Dendrobium thyrsiflorum TaxID=117978 RepID=A0ABD0VVK9_DENTH
MAFSAATSSQREEKREIGMERRREIERDMKFKILNLRSEFMVSPGRSMLYSLLLFIIILSLLEMYRGTLASSEVLTIAGGLISSLLFVVMLTFIGNYQESCGSRTGWGAVILAESIALIAASTVHRVCITTWYLWILFLNGHLLFSFPVCPLGFLSCGPWDSLLLNRGLFCGLLVSFGLLFRVVFWLMCYGLMAFSLPLFYWLTWEVGGYLFPSSFPIYYGCFVEDGLVDFGEFISIKPEGLSSLRASLLLRLLFRNLRVSFVSASNLFLLYASDNSIFVHEKIYEKFAVMEEMMTKMLELQTKTTSSEAGRATSGQGSGENPNMMRREEDHFLFSAGFLYEINKLSTLMFIKGEAKTKRH